MLSAYLAASIAAGFAMVLEVLLIEFAQALLQGRWQAAGSMAMALLIVPLMLGGWFGFFVMIVAFVPALGFIAVAEAARVRAAWFYGSAGIVTAIVGSGWWLGPGRAGPAAAVPMEWGIVGAAGMIAGLTYWAIAGRTAGAWRVRQPAEG
jgi:hypothetical protein